MESGVVSLHLARRALLVVAALCLAALLAPGSVVAASADALRPPGTWTWVDPWPQGLKGDLRQVDFTDARNGWLLADADYPVLLHTIDGGRTWSWHAWPMAPRYLQPDLLDFTTADEGWALANGEAGDHTPVAQLLHTSDAGAHWEVVRIGDRPVRDYGGELVSTLGSLSHVEFVDTRHGWVVGRGAPGDEDDEGDARLVGYLVVHTRDGGVTWTHSIPVEGLAWPTGMAVLGANGAIVVGHKGDHARSGFALRTDDGGRTWLRRDFDLPLMSVGRVTDKVLWAAGRWTHSSSNAWEEWEEGLFMTCDGGRSWRRVLSSSGERDGYNAHAPYQPIVFVSPRWGFAREFQGKGQSEWLETTDGGMTWTPAEGSELPLIEEAVYRSQAAWVTPSLGWALAPNGGLLRFQIGPDRVGGLP